MPPNLTYQDWRSLAEQVSKEMDPEKLRALVSQLCHSLEERQKTLRFQRHEEDQARPFPMPRR